MTVDWWTLGIQAVNVIILIWLLARFFWRPVAAMIEQRRATAQQILTEAETKRSQATDALAEIERTRAGFDREREAVIIAAHEAAEEARTAILAVGDEGGCGAGGIGKRRRWKRSRAPPTQPGPSGLICLRSKLPRRLVSRLNGRS